MSKRTEELEAQFYQSDRKILSMEAALQQEKTNRLMIQGAYNESVYQSKKAEAKVEAKETKKDK